MHRILIVDNEEKLRQAIVKYARFQGYETAEATDGLEAVAYCQAQVFDLILLDVMQEVIQTELVWITGIALVLLAACALCGQPPRHCGYRRHHKTAAHLLRPA